MAVTLQDRIKETTTTSGTGAITLLGAPSTFFTFSNVGNGGEVYYCISHRTANQVEVGRGTYTLATNSLSRDTVYRSSNSNALVNFSSGTKDVAFVTPATFISNLAALGHAHAASDITSGTMATARLGSGTADSTTFLRGDSTWVTITSNPGTVTSVGLSLPNIFSVSGSPVTSSGTLAGSLATQTANTFFSGPSSGSPATPTFRVLAASDLPVGIGVLNTLGDTLYGGASGALTRLSGNTTTSRNFLTQTGDGVNSAAPSWFNLFGTSNTFTDLQRIEFTNAATTTVNEAVRVTHISTGVPAAGFGVSFAEYLGTKASGTSGTISSSTYSATYPAAVGSGYSLDFGSGSGDVTLPINLNLLSDITLSFWAYFRTITGTRDIATNDNGSYGRNIRITSSSINVMNSNSAPISYGSGFSTGVWLHVAVTWSASATILYINGSQVATGSGSVTGLDDLTTYRLGRFDGLMDHVKFFAEALSASDIAILASGGEPSSSRQFAFYKFDEGSGTSTTNNVSSTVQQPAGSWESTWASVTWPAYYSRNAFYASGPCGLQEGFRVEGGFSTAKIGFGGAVDSSALVKVNGTSVFTSSAIFGGATTDALNSSVITSVGNSGANVVNLTLWNKNSTSSLDWYVGTGHSNAVAPVRLLVSDDGYYSGNLRLFFKTRGSFANSATEKFRFGADGTLGVGTTTPASPVHAVITDTASAAVSAALTLGHNLSSGSPSSGMGTGLTLQAQSSTTADRNLAKIQASWATETDTSRKGRLILYVSDNTADREGLRIESDGAQARIGFLGAVDNMYGVQVNQIAATTGSPGAWQITGASHTTLTASTEATDINFNLARTVQFATGALTTQRAVRIQAPTYAFVGASTLSEAVTFDVDGPPIAGTNATITRAYAALIHGLFVIRNGNTVNQQIETWHDGSNGKMWIKAGEMRFIAPNGTTEYRISDNGHYTQFSGAAKHFYNSSAFTLASNIELRWSNLSDTSSGGDCGIDRVSAGLLEVTVGSAGNYGQLRLGYRDAVTNTIGTALTVGRQVSSGTPGNGIGVSISFTISSSTTVNQNAGLIACSWIDATHATRASSLSLSAYYTSTSQEGIRITGDTSGVKLGLFGTTPAAQSTGWSVSNVTTDKVFDADATTLDEVADVLGTLINALKLNGFIGA